MKITKGMNMVVKDGKVYGYDVATGNVYNTATFEKITDDSENNNKDTANSGTEESSNKAKMAKIK